MQEQSQFHERGRGRRTGLDRREPADRRATIRRKHRAQVPVDRRAGVDRRTLERRTNLNRRTATDRRRPLFGAAPGGIIGTMERRPRSTPHTAKRAHVGERSARDREQARLLPDAFVEASGTAIERLSLAIRRAWPRMPVPIRAGVAEQVLPILEPLIASDTPAPITDAIRDACEEATMRGIRRRPD